MMTVVDVILLLWHFVVVECFWFGNVSILNGRDLRKSYCEKSWDTTRPRLRWWWWWWCIAVISYWRFTLYSNSSVHVLNAGTVEILKRKNVGGNFRKNKKNKTNRQQQKIIHADVVRDRNRKLSSCTFYSLVYDVRVDLAFHVIN